MRRTGRRWLGSRSLIWRHTHTTGPQADTDPTTGEPTVLIENFLEFVGAGWHTTGDAILATTAADMARRRREAAREAITITTALAA